MFHRIPTALQSHNDLIFNFSDRRSSSVTTSTATLDSRTQDKRTSDDVTSNDNSADENDDYDDCNGYSVLERTDAPVEHSANQYESLSDVTSETSNA